MTDWIRQREDAAAAKVSAALALPIPEDQYEIGSDGTFDPWNLFPALYGSYCGSFDRCALDVLRELRDGEKRRDDLGAEMFREMLCTSDLCSYGTSPRVCFPNTKFEELLPELIDKWRAYSMRRWGDGWDPFLPSE